VRLSPHWRTVQVSVATNAPSPRPKRCPSES